MNTDSAHYSDLDALSTDELHTLLETAQKKIAMRRQSQIYEAYEKIKSIADNSGMTIEEIIEFSKNKPELKTKRKATPKYINPENPNLTWSGRGKAPRWLATQIANGKSKSDFLIKK